MAKRANAAAGGSTRARPWWLDPGDEDCPHCDGTYAYHVEARCLECDAPLCPMCIVRVGKRMLCAGCRDAARSE